MRTNQQQAHEAAKVFLFVVTALLFGAIAFTFFGCAAWQGSSAVPAPAPAPKYELTLGGSIDDVPISGVGIGSSATSHSITIQSMVAVDYFTMSSCHRSVQFNNVITVPWYQWGSDNKSFTFQYDEAPTIEDTGDCLLRFCAFSKTVGSPPSSCAVVDFHNAKYSLPSNNICNGVNGQATGTMMCHTQQGLVERVQFPVPVQVAPPIVDPTGKTAPYAISDQCAGKFLNANQTLFEYVMPTQECYVIFDEIAKPHRRAKLTVIPYNQALYQGQ